MNRIYWDKDKILIVTNQLEAIKHRHCMLQLFFGLEKELNICVAEKDLKSKCILVNQNVNHSFLTGRNLHMSLIIDTTSDLAEQLNRLIAKNEYHIFDSEQYEEIEKYGYALIRSNDIDDYRKLIQVLYSYLGISESRKLYDDRITKLLHSIEHCDCDEHSISFFAEKVSLSPSRLSHLFRAQVGIPLKSYIQLHQMQKAFLALLEGRSITEAAMLAKFDSPSHFAAVTKRMMGTPASISLKNSEFLKVF